MRCDKPCALSFQKGRECPSVRRQGIPPPVLGRGQAMTALTLCRWGSVLHMTGLLLQPPPGQTASEQRPEPGFAAVDPEFWDAGTLSEADGQLLIHPLHLLWRKAIGVREPQKAGGPCPAWVGRQLEGAGLPKSAGDWHLQHHPKHRALDTSSESSGRGFPTSRGKDAHPCVLWRRQLWGMSLTLYRASGNPVEGLWPS